MDAKIKRQKWIQAREAVDHLADALGHGIDKGIKETVVAFRVHGILTTASCEGHLHWGMCYPWVDVGVYAPPEWGREKNWWKNSRKMNLLEKRGLLEAKKLVKLLDLFYRDRSVSYDTRLVMKPAGWGDWRLQSAGGPMIDLYPKSERSRRLFRYQKEMRTFGLLLKKRFF